MSLVFGFLVLVSHGPDPSTGTKSVPHPGKSATVMAVNSEQSMMLLAAGVPQAWNLATADPKTGVVKKKLNQVKFPRDAEIRTMVPLQGGGYLIAPTFGFAVLDKDLSVSNRIEVGYLNRAAVNKDQTLLAWTSFSRNPETVIYDLKKKTVKWRIQDNDIVGEILFLRDDLLLTAGFNGVFLMDTKTEKKKQISKRGPHTIAFHPPSNLVALGESFGQLTLLNLQTFLEISLKGHDADITALAFSPDGTFLVSATRAPPFVDNELRVWDVTNKAMMKRAKQGAESRFVLFLDDGKRFTTGQLDKAGNVELYLLADFTNALPK